MSLSPKFRGMLVGGCWLLLVVAAAHAQAPAPSPVPKPAPTMLRETWVPATSLKTVLERYPRAVPLRLDQLLALLHDAQAADPAVADPAKAPPVRAVLRQARFEAWPVAGADGVNGAQVRVDGEIDIESFSDGWTEVPVGLARISLGSASLDDANTPASLLHPHGGFQEPVTLRLQGRGAHRLHVDYLLAVEGRPDGSRISLPSVFGAAEFVLHLPANSRVMTARGCAVEADGNSGGLLARVSLDAAASGFREADLLTWRAVPPVADEAANLRQDFQLFYKVEAAAITARLRLKVVPLLGRPPGSVRLPLPAGAHAVRVEGDPVAGWGLAPDGLHFDLAGEDAPRDAAEFTVFYELPLTLDPAGAISKVDLPLPEIAGIYSVAGNVALQQGEGVRVQRVEASSVATAGVQLFDEGTENSQDFVGGYAVADLPGKDHAAPVPTLTAEARRTRTRFSVDADAQVDFPPGIARVTRNLTFRVEEGSLFTARVTLPDGESLTLLNPLSPGAAPEWRQEGGDLVLTWNTGVPEGEVAKFQFITQSDFAAPKVGAPTVYHLRAAPVAGAERTAGYIAVGSAPALRIVTTGGDERLERRDARATPVHGEVAWFYRDSFDLAVRVERRATETEARFVGYALPQAGTVEIHGQLACKFLFSGVESVKIRVPREFADAFFFSGPRIAERKLEGDVWTIRFQGEQTGDYALGIRATLPSPADPGDAERFHFRLPSIVPLDTARWSGVWAVEANTDTEITFGIAGASEADALHAPALADYQPKRRIIGVFEFLGGGAPEPAITLDGARHPAANSAAAVVDRLELETLVATSGSIRQLATIHARTAGDEFFNIHLPEGATLWSLTRDGAAIKPVGGAAGVLRVELPGGRLPPAASTVAALYELPDRAWNGSGRQTLAAPAFDPGVPVLASRWTVRLPDGFHYSGFDSGLETQAFDSGLETQAHAVQPGDLLLPQLGRSVWRALQWIYYRPLYQMYRASGMVDSSAPGVRPPQWINDQMRTGGADMAVNNEVTALPSAPMAELVLPPASTAKVETTVERERARREGSGGSVGDAIRRGDADVIRLDYQSAVNNYRQAVDALNDAPATSERRVDALKKFFNASMELANQRIVEGRYLDAEAIVKVVLLPQYDPGYKPAIELAQHLEDPEYFNQTVGPKFIEKVQQVKALFRDAQGFFDSARYDMAFRRYEQVLALDPYNDAARMGEERVDHAKLKHSKNAAYPETRARFLSQVAGEWELPVPRRGLDLTRDDQGPAAMNRKLAKIIIPDIDFRNTPLSEAIEFLREQSERFNPDPNLENRRINIFLKLPGTKGNTEPSNRARITLSMRNLPLSEALRYVASQAGMKVKVETYAVSIVPVTDQTDALVTGEFNVPVDFFRSSPGTTGTGTAVIARQDAKTFLEASGVTFPPGASATYIASTGKLIVRNTQENMDLIKPLENVPATAGNRTGTYGVSANAIDALLFGKPNNKAQIPGIFSVAGVFTDPQFAQLARGINGQPKVAGLLPMRLDLPASGRAYTFAGGGAPGTLDFHYADWRAESRWQWVWLTLGALGFLLGAAGWAHPWRRMCLVMIVLTFWPLIVAPGTAFACNALLGGWLWATLGWIVTRGLLRRRHKLPRVVLPVLAACGWWWLPAHARADEPKPAPTPAGEMVVVPYDVKQPLSGQEPDATYYLPYERFLELWEAAKRHRHPAPPAPPPGEAHYSLNTARYDARLADDRVLTVTGTIDFQTFGEEWVGVPFGFGEAQVSTLTIDGAPAPIDGENRLWVGKPGAHRATVLLAVRVGRVQPHLALSWNIPPAVATTLTALCPRSDFRFALRTTAPGEGGEVQESVPEGWRLTASVGSADWLELSFQEAIPDAPPLTTIPVAHVEAQLSVGGRQETLRVETHYAFPGGSENEFAVELEPGLTLTDLDAPDLKSWRLETGGAAQTLTVVLNAPARDNYHFSLAASRPGSGAGERRFPLVSASASRVELVAALLTSGAVELSLPAGLPPGVRRTDYHAKAEGHAFAAFESNGSSREVPPSAKLTYGVHSASDKRVARINYLYQIGHGKIELTAAITLNPGTGSSPVSHADLRLPPGFAVQTVAGDAVKQWWTDGDRLSLRLHPGKNEGTSVVIYLVRSFDKSPVVFALRPLVAEGFAEVSGETLVAADRSFKVSLALPVSGTGARDLTDIPADKAAAEFQVRAPLERQRAFRYRGAGFDVPATLDVLPPQWQAQWVTHATVRDGTVALETHVNVSVHQGMVDAVEFTLPGQPAEGRVSGPDVRETLSTPLEPKDNATGHSYRVLLQNPVYGGSETSFTCNLDLPLAPGTRLELPDFVFRNAAATRAAGGFLLVENLSSGEMSLDAGGLDPATPKEVPFVPEQTAAGTRFFRAVPGVPWKLTLGVTGLEKSAGRAALVAYAELTSTLRANGEEWHRAVYRLQNRRLQFLPVELPPGMEFIGARVAGDPMRVDAGPAAEKGRAPTLLVPLLKTRPGELSYDVELVYRRPVTGPGWHHEQFFRRWDMTDPHLEGVPVEKTLWDVYLPSDARLLGQGGNVEPVVAALSETEKLESALTDLRSLSATYRSGGASNKERQRALSNFNSLANSVSQQATVVDAVKTKPAALVAAVPTPEPLGLLRKTAITSQNNLIVQKQEAIRRELATLSTANSAVGGSSITVNDDRNYDINGGLSGKFYAWKDQRGASSLSGFAGTTENVGALAKNPDPNAGHDTEAGKANFAINDSVSVNLPRGESKKSTFDDPTQFQPPVIAGNDGTPHGLLDVTRAKDPQPAGAKLALNQATQKEDLSRQTSAPHLVILNGRSVQDEAGSTPAPPPPDEAPEPELGSRDGKMPFTGRISLAVDFPLEGQVYHFKKVKDEARLTLQSTRPASFERPGWLLGLVMLTGAWWAAQTGKRRFFPVKPPAVVVG